jgi:hypothetical protein
MWLSISSEIWHSFSNSLTDLSFPYILLSVFGELPVTISSEATSDICDGKE